MKMTKVSFMFFYALHLCASNLYSQYKMDCNTIFVCISKENYAQLFQNSFVKDTLFLCKENSTTTTTDSYTGKYLLGEFGTIEFIQPSDNINFGDKLDDIGIEFKTRRKGDLIQLKNEATPNKLVIKDISINESDKSYLWYSELKLVKHPINFEVSILEYSPNYSEELGFSKEQLNEEISPSTYNQIVYQGKAYPRKFKSFKSVSIEVNSEGKKYLKQMAKNYNFNFNQNFVICNDFIIYYKFNNKIKNTILKNIEINLTESLTNKEITISESIAISITNYNAKIIFKN